MVSFFPIRESSFQDVFVNQGIKTEHRVDVAIRDRTKRRTVVSTKFRLGKSLLAKRHAARREIDSNQMMALEQEKSRPSSVTRRNPKNGVNG